MTARRIGVDVWWDPEKSIYRKKKLDLDKIPIQFRCPCCGAAVVSPRDRNPKLRKIVNADAHNKQILDKYFERDRPPREEFLEWRERIMKKHADEFKENVYIESYSPPIKLETNSLFYGLYVCDKCVKNHPSRHTLEHHQKTQEVFECMK